jgi:hypothetical protein
MKASLRHLVTAGLVAVGLLVSVPAQGYWTYPVYDPSAAYQQQMMAYQQMQAYQQQMQAYQQQLLQAYMANPAAFGPVNTGLTAMPNTNFQSLQESIAGSQSAFNDYLSSVQAGSAARDEATYNFSNAILNQQEYVDPNTGTTHMLDNMSNYQWIDSQGNTTGTDTYTPPDYTSGWTALDPVE